MTKHDDRKSQARERAQRTGEKYTEALRAVQTRPRLMLPLPEPVSGSDGCQPCGGSGVQAWVDFATPEANAVMVCPVLCGQCHGCGRRWHEECDPQQHDDPEEFGYDPYDDDRDDDGEERCYSCRGLRSWLMQGYDHNSVYYVRVPCGCAADLLVAAP